MQRQWLKARCLICGKEYEYLSDFKPSTCGKYDCLQKMELRRDRAISAEKTGTIPHDLDNLPMDADY